MSDCSIVLIGPNPQSNLDLQENVYTLVQFLFEKHQEFDLEESSTETYLLPKYELTLIRLILREFEKLQECVNLETLLSYLGLAVNIKDSLRLLKIFNLPYRGLNEHTFTTLRKIAQCDNLSVTQVSFRLLLVSFQTTDTAGS
ncbi:unnamed protein product [Trichobilharzia regenti]|nr:unnamed protein product [Trichobilharzia regenti]